MNDNNNGNCDPPSLSWTTTAKEKEDHNCHYCCHSWCDHKYSTGYSHTSEIVDINSVGSVRDSHSLIRQRHGRPLFLHHTRNCSTVSTDPHSSQIGSGPLSDPTVRRPPNHCNTIVIRVCYWFESDTYS